MQRITETALPMLCVRGLSQDAGNVCVIPAMQGMDKCVCVSLPSSVKCMLFLCSSGQMIIFLPMLISSAINPCLDGNGGCGNNSQCVHTGSNKVTKATFKLHRYLQFAYSVVCRIKNKKGKCSSFLKRNILQYLKEWEVSWNETTF